MRGHPLVRASTRFVAPALSAGGFALAAVLATAAFTVRPAAAECPASDIVCLDGDPNSGGSMSTTTDPTYSSNCSGWILNVAGASFAVPAGSFEVYVGEGGRIDLRLRDLFTITGPSPGSPISLHMRVRVHGSLIWWGACCPDSQAHVDLVPLEPQPGDPSPQWWFGKDSGPQGSFSFADSLDITLQRTAGAPIGIEIHAYSRMNASSSSDLIGELSFPDLPQGWTVTSCKGYRKDQPVPALPVSWGHVKASYR